MLPTHPGAAAFLDGEEETFFDKYSDMIYIGAMIGGVIVSGLATLASRLAVSGYDRFDQLMETALTILKSGREADSLEALSRLEIQIDEILTRSLAAAEMPKLDNHQLAALTLADSAGASRHRRPAKPSSAGGPRRDLPLERRPMSSARDRGFGGFQLLRFSYRSSTNHDEPA